MFDLSKKEPSLGRGQPAKGTGGARAEGQPAGHARSETAGIAVIGRSIKIDGDLRGDEDLRIEGDVSGTIQLPNHCLTIGREGRIRADAYAKSVTIEGEVSGDLFASECVSIRASANVAGNVLAARVSLEEGARFKGSIDMDPKSVEGALSKHEIRPVTRSDGGRSERPRQATLANVRSPPTESGAAPHAAGDKGSKAEPAH